MNHNGIPTYPYLKPWYRVAHEEKRLVLEYAQAVIVFEGEAVQRLLPALLPLLDGTRSIDEVTAALGQPIEPAIMKALSMLAERGLLTAGPPLDDDTPASFLNTAHFLSASAYDAPPISRTHAALRRAKLAVAGTGLAAEEITRLLRRSGIDYLSRVSEDDDTGLEELDLVVVAPASEELPRLGEWNRRALRANLAWLQVLPFDGKFAAIGPLYLPGETCCYECYLLRRQSNVDYRDEFTAIERSRASYPEAPPIVAAIAGVATTLVLRWIAHRDRVLPGGFYALEHAANFGLTFHRVYRVPRCALCSGLDQSAPPLPWYKEVRVESH